MLVARGAERLASVADELGAEHEVCDVSERESVDRMATAVMARHPRIGKKLTYDVVADRRSGKSAAENLRAA